MTGLSPTDLLAIHEVILQETKGSSGLRDPGLLESIASKPWASFGGGYLYPDIFSKAAALYEAAINYHAFVDGNKRTAVASLGLFLYRNGHDLTVTDQELEDFTVGIASSQPDLADVAAWVKIHSKKLG
jgi:death-on-curing protein